jgi:ParB family chromosome partitioning protein
LKLANVSPRLVALYRKEEVSFDQMMALAISDSHTTQEQVWDSLDKWSRQPHQLRKLLTAQQINVESDKVARFVGVSVFEKAGGTITRDLFSDSGTGYISDAALLESLAAAKLAKAAAKLDKEGFAWVDVRVRVDRSDLTDYAKVRTTCRKQTDEEQTALAALGAELDKLEDEIDAAHDAEDGNPDPLYERQEVLEAKQTVILQGLNQPDPADKLLAGALVTIDDSGKPIIYRDLIRPDDKSKMAKIGNTAGAATSDEKAPKLKPVHSDRLTTVLTAHRTIALQAEMMNRPDVAFVVLTERLIKQVFFPHDYHEKITQISLQHPTLAKDVQSGSASIAFAAKREALLAQLPEDGDALLAWLLEQPQATVFDYMAFCTACSLNAVQTREQASPVFIEIAKAVNLNMGNWWKPTAETYFNHVSKARMVDVVTQAVSADAARPLDKLKKSPAADAAERSVALTCWLPEVLRT